MMLAAFAPARPALASLAEDAPAARAGDPKTPVALALRRGAKPGARPFRKRSAEAQNRRGRRDRLEGRGRRERLERRGRRDRLERQERRRQSPPPGARDRRNDHDRARDAVRRGNARPLSEIIPALQSYCGSDFLDASLEQRGRRLLYRVRLLSRGGRRVTLLVDAASGEILSGRCR